jgi:hypothetical protein
LTKPKATGVLIKNEIEELKQQVSKQYYD